MKPIRQTKGSSKSIKSPNRFNPLNKKSNSKRASIYFKKRKPNLPKELVENKEKKDFIKKFGKPIAGER